MSSRCGTPAGASSDCPPANGHRFRSIDLQRPGPRRHGRRVDRRHGRHPADPRRRRRRSRQGDGRHPVGPVPGDQHPPVHDGHALRRGGERQHLGAAVGLRRPSPAVGRGLRRHVRPLAFKIVRRAPLPHECGDPLHPNGRALPVRRPPGHRRGPLPGRLRNHRGGSNSYHHLDHCVVWGLTGTGIGPGPGPGAEVKVVGGRFTGARVGIGVHLTGDNGGASSTPISSTSTTGC